MYELRVFVGRHVGLVPIAIAIIAIVFAVSFRSLAAAALPLIDQHQAEKRNRKCDESK